MSGHIALQLEAFIGVPPTFIDGLVLANANNPSFGTICVQDLTRTGMYATGPGCVIKVQAVLGLALRRRSIVPLDVGLIVFLLDNFD